MSFCMLLSTAYIVPLACTLIAQVQANSYPNNDGGARNELHFASDNSESCNNKIYWTDQGTDTISRANLDGSDWEVVLVDLNNPRGIVLDSIAGKMYFTQGQLGGGDSGKVMVSRLDGTEVEELVSGLHVPIDIALDRLGGKLYWANTGGGTKLIQRANLDGSNVEIIVGASARGVALDLHNGKIYWTNVTNDGGGVGHRLIQRANLDGGAKETILDDLGTPDGIALDVANDKMYWTDQSYDTVQRADFDGENVEILVDTGLDRPYGLALNLAEGKMYWTDWGTSRIQRANLDGSDVEIIVSSGLDFPLWIALLSNPDCNNNGASDECDIADGTSMDRNEDGIPDECECIDDDGDGKVTICHLPPGNRSNAQTISVNVNAVPKHLAHGDHCGPCEDGGG